MTDSSWLLAPRGTLLDGATVVLDPGEARHAVSALRLRAGDPVVLADGAGKVARAVLRKVASRAIEAEILKVSSEPAPAGDGVTLALGILHASWPGGRSGHATTTGAGWPGRLSSSAGAHGR
jgi:hypothetical protein